MGEWLLSRRDRLTVAWHAVSWSLEIRTLGEGHFGVIYAPKVAPGLSPAFQPAHKRWANGLSPGGDGAIVAWHEVPGTAPPKKPSRRVRSDSGMRAHAVSNPINELSRAPVRPDIGCPGHSPTIPKGSDHQQRMIVQHGQMFQSPPWPSNC
jgi:hypothetical protein